MKDYCLLIECDYSIIKFKNEEDSFEELKKLTKNKALFNLGNLEITPKFLGYMLKLFRYALKNNKEIFFISDYKEEFNNPKFIDFNRYFKVFSSVEEYNKLKTYAKFEVKIYDDNSYIKKLIKDELLKNGFRIKDRKSINFFKKTHDSMANSIYLIDFDSMQEEKILEIKKIKEKNSESIIILMCISDNIEKGLSMKNIDIDGIIKRPFRIEDLIEKIKYIANSAELKLTNKELMMEVLEREYEISKLYNNLNEELLLASEIQKSFMPPKKIEFNNYLIEYMYIPSSSIGGDFCDFIKINENRFAIVFADISGHGIPAALLSSMLKVFIYNNAPKFKDNVELMQTLNEEIINIFPSGKFVSLFYIVIDTEKNDIRYIKASQESALMYKKNYDEIIELDTEGQILGLFSKKVFGDINFEEKSLTFDLGDNLLLYTDGITESVNDEGEYYGLDNLKKHIKRSSLEEIKLDLEKFLGNKSMSDDLTLLKIKRMR